MIALFKPGRRYQLTLRLLVGPQQGRCRRMLRTDGGESRWALCSPWIAIKWNDYTRTGAAQAEFRVEVLYPNLLYFKKFYFEIIRVLASSAIVKSVLACIPAVRAGRWRGVFVWV